VTIELEELLEAWRAIFRTHDGQMAILYLRGVLMEVPPPGSEACAVHENVGRRRVAQELLTLAMSANDARSGNADHADDARNDFAVARGRAARVGAVRNGSRGAGPRGGSRSISNLDD
jgi:hypothetical protein